VFAPKKKVVAAAAPKCLQKVRRVKVKLVFKTVSSVTSLQNEHVSRKKGMSRPLAKAHYACVDWDRGSFFRE
jgi:hypothetical protein